MKPKICSSMISKNIFFVIKKISILLILSTLSPYPLGVESPFDRPDHNDKHILPMALLIRTMQIFGAVGKGPLSQGQRILFSSD